MKQVVTCLAGPALPAAFVMLLMMLTGPAHLPAQQFSKITSEPQATHIAAARSVNWIDVTGDGYLDLFVTRGKAGGQNNMLYRNDGPPDFTFTAMDTAIVSRDGEPSDGSSWGDINNDGSPDLFVANWYNRNNLLYLNHGQGLLERILTGPVVNDHGYSEAGVWGDYNNDGLLDLYVANSAGAKLNFLYRNLGGGTFEKVTTGAPATDVGTSRGVSWVDYDNDGDMDLLVAREEGQNELLYKNMLAESGTVSFTKLTGGDLLTAGGSSWSASWGDYDNDGRLDVFITNWGAAGQNRLYHNDGGDVFSSVGAGPLTTQNDTYGTAAWGDYDNDGDLDLIVTTAYGTAATHCYLYANQLRETGSAQFVSVTGEPVVNALGNWYGTSWGDYDEDGDLDLFVAGTLAENSTSGFYRNNGNANSWLSLDLVGTASNRSAIGAHVRIKGIIGGTPVWQLQEVSGQSGYCGQTLQLHFGLGDAASIDSMVIDWPSGHREIFTGVDARRHLCLVEGDTTGVNLVAPLDGILDLPPGIHLQWDPGLYPPPYYVQVCTEPSFTTGLVVDDSTMIDATLFLDSLQEYQRYYWRVRPARAVAGEGAWSETRSFAQGKPRIMIAAAGRWNLVSVPYPLAAMNASAVFPTAQSGPYTFNGTAYQPAEALQRGTGYWIRYRTDTTLVFIGDDTGSVAPILRAGWNLIGLGPSAFPVSQLQTVPPGILQSGFFGYTNRYVEVDTLAAGRGYWVKSEQDGLLLVSPALSGPAVTVAAGMPERLLRPAVLTFRDAAGSEGELRIGIEGGFRASQELPPPPPGGLDVRFPSGSTVALVRKNIIRSIPIQINGAVYPVTLAWKNVDSVQARLVTGDGQPAADLTGSGTIELPAAPRRLMLEVNGMAAGAGTDLPQVSSLRQNYPNPFNPSTSIAYSLREESFITLKVYDLTGKEVGVLVNSRAGAGEHTAVWDASAMPSGVYYYRLAVVPLRDPTGGYTEQRNMTLLK